MTRTGETVNDCMVLTAGIKLSGLLVADLPTNFFWGTLARGDGQPTR
jgi:hypothetical protein